MCCDTPRQCCEIFCGQGADFYKDRLSKLVLRSDKCLNRLDDFVKNIDRQKTCDRANCKGQVPFTVHGERQLKRIVHSQQSQTLAQITIQLKDGASRIVNKPYGFQEPHRPTRVPLPNTCHQASRLASARELRHWSVED
ncbi:HTH_Tnp_Tc3_2 domain-containing protein [Trichonephila clavipes]|nr:HTH_Tnp_Tc3_2 domain-containing protein [Trichonephila clavipes]